MFCDNCGKQLADGSKFCDGCGAKLEAPQTAPQPQAAPQPQPQMASPRPQVAHQPQPQMAPPPQMPPQQNYNQQYQMPPMGNMGMASPPLSVGQYLLMFIIMAVPILNIIMIFKWAFGKEPNMNKKNYARSLLIIMAVMIVIYILIGATLMATFSGLRAGMTGF